MKELMKVMMACYDDAMIKAPRGRMDNDEKK